MTADTSGTFAEMFIIIALARLIDHVEHRCQTEGEDYPVIVNLSFGLSAGPKDGSSLLDRFIDAIGTHRGPDRAAMQFVVPAGNHRLARCYAHLDRPLTAERPPLWWHLPPDDPTPSFMEIWSAPMHTAPSTLPLSLSLQSPMHHAATPLAAVPMDTVQELRAADALLARAYVQWVPNGSGGRIRLTLVTPPTIPGGRESVCVPSGDWRILIEPAEGTAPIAWPLDLMIQRDDMIPGYRTGGRQSRFEDSQYRVSSAGGFTFNKDRKTADGHWPYVRRRGTMNALATARDTVVVAGCYADTLELVGYSGEGAGKAGIREPDASAPASFNRLRGGIQAAGSRSGSRVGVEGTSVAAPTLSRELAKATRPMRERPRLSGVPLLHADLKGNKPPAVLPVAENVKRDRYEPKTSANQVAN